MAEYKILSIFFKEKGNLFSGIPANVSVEWIADSAAVKSLSNPEVPAIFPEETILVLYSPTIEEVPADEFAQIICFKYPQAPIFYIASNKNEIRDRASLIKNGFTDVFVYPFDADLLSREIKAVFDRADANNKKKKAFSPVRLIDIQPNSTVDFDIYILLSANNKYVKFVPAGGFIDEKRYARLKENEANLLFVPKESMPAFYKYTATALKKLSGAAGSETERQHKVETSLRTLVGKIFDESRQAESPIEEGKQIFSHLQQIVTEYINQGDNASFYKRMMITVGGYRDPYSHASRVSTMAFLFSMALGVGKPEDLAMAGLMHDIGVAVIPAEVTSKNSSQWTKDEAKVYESHPELSLRLVKERRIVLSQGIEEAILYHHRKWNGSGYPVGNVNVLKMPEAQVLAIADEFDYLTAAEMGKTTISPQEAFEQMVSRMEHNFVYLKKLQKLFGAPPEEINTKAGL